MQFLSRNRFLSSLLLLALSLALVRCDGHPKAVSPQSEKDISPPRSLSPKPAPQPLVVVNGVALFPQDLPPAPQDPSSALKTLIEEELVAQEARRAEGFDTKPGENRRDLSRRFLETVYSADTLCRSITRGEIRSFYQATYRKDWPASLYYGRLLEIRCADPADNPLDATVLRCLGDNAKIVSLFERIRERWESDPTWVEPDWFATYPKLVSTDFGFLDWEGIPQHKQTRDPLFDPATRELIKSLPLNVASHPIKSTLGFHMVMVTEYRPAVTPDTPEFKEKARSLICEKRIDRVRNDYLERLLDAAELQEGSASLDGIRERRRSPVQIR